MNAAEDQKRSRRGKGDLDSFSRLLRAGIKIKRGIENPHVMGSGIVVDDPQAATALKRDVSGMEVLSS